MKDIEWEEVVLLLMFVFGGLSLIGLFVLIWVPTVLVLQIVATLFMVFITLGIVVSNLY